MVTRIPCPTFSFKKGKKPRNISGLFFLNRQNQVCHLVIRYGRFTWFSLNNIFHLNRLTLSFHEGRCRQHIASLVNCSSGFTSKYRRGRGFGGLSKEIYS